MKEYGLIMVNLMTNEQSRELWIERVKYVVSTNEVVLYMKGSSFYPLCGYSAAIAQMLNYLGVSYIDIDVLKTPELSKAVKEITKWPFIPQLFVGGHFVGGCDTVRAMFDDGSLIDLFIKEKIPMNAESYYFNNLNHIKSFSAAAE